MLLNLVVTLVVLATTARWRSACLTCTDTELYQKVLLWLFVLIVCCDSNPNNVIPAEGEDLCKTISPREAFFLEGEDLDLTCNGKDADSLTFLNGNEPLPEEFIHKLNSTAIRLIHKVTAKDIGRNKHSTPYRCVNINKTLCYDVVHVRLEYYPRKPQDLQCRDYDLDELTCIWSLGVEYGHHVNVTCEKINFYYKGDNPDGNWALCPQQNETFCHWNSEDYFAPWKMQVKVSVTARNITEILSKDFLQHDIVEPGPVNELRVKVSYRDERCVELEWEPTKRNYSFKFVVTYSSTCEIEKTKIVYYTAGMTYSEGVKWSDKTICGLIPYTDYTFSIKGRFRWMKEVDNKTYVERGYWSKANNLTARTDSDVIDVNPLTVPGLYEISSISQPGLLGYHSLQLYWMPLPSCDLHDAPESVTYKVTAHNVTSSVQHPAFSAQINIPEKKIINVTLQAWNSVGHPESNRAVTVFPDMFGPNLSELIIQYNNTDKSCMTHVDVVVTEKGSSFSDLSHTLVWCKGTQLSCQKPVQWQKLGENVTSFVWPGNMCGVDYRYGLVTHGYSKGQGQIVDTGIHWEHCMYLLGEVPDKPIQDIQLTEFQPENGLAVEWKPYSCKDMKAYITHYQVIYCIGQGVEDCKCKDEERRVNVSRNLAKYTVRDLEAGSHVCLWVRGISKAGVGPVNKIPLVHKIPTESGILTVHVVLIVMSAIVFLGLLVVVFWYCRRKLAKYKREASNIRIPGGPEIDHLLESRQVPPVENGRTYSMIDIIDALGNDQPKDKSPSAENYQLQDINNDPTDGQNGTFPSFTKDKSAGIELEEHDGLKDKRFVERDGAKYLMPVKDENLPKKDVIESDEAQMDSGHCRHSISSALSDAHTESYFHSLEDLIRVSDKENNLLPNSELVLNINDKGIKPIKFPSEHGNLLSENVTESSELGTENATLHSEGTDESKGIDYVKMTNEGNTDAESGEGISENVENIQEENSVIVQDSEKDQINNDGSSRTDSDFVLTEQIGGFENSDYKPFSVACHKVIADKNEDQESVSDVDERAVPANQDDSIKSNQQINGLCNQVYDRNQVSLWCQ